jgi:preprotein translocase subunit SecB
MTRTVSLDPSNLVAPLQVVDYTVDAVEYSTDAHDNQEFIEEDEGRFDLTFLPNTREGDAHGMRMSIRLGGGVSTERDESGESFNVRVQVTGHFQFVDDPSDRPEPETLRHFFFTTSVGTLYGIVREQVRDITSQSNLPSVLLPVVNLGAIAQSLEDEESLKHFQFEDSRSQEE